MCTVSTELPEGLLVYAEGEAEDVVHHIHNVDMRLRVVTLDLAGTVEDLRAEIGGLVDTVRQVAAVERAPAELKVRRLPDDIGWRPE